MKQLTDSRRLSFTRFALCLLIIAALFITASFSKRSQATVRAITVVTERTQDVPETVHVVFSNAAAIVCADRASNNAGTNPGLPPLYPSPIVVSGMSGNITKVTVTFAITSTFPDDLDVLLEGPTGARSLVMSDAGGSGDHTNVSFTWDQTAAALMPDGPTTPIPTGTFKPSNYVGLATPEPGGADNFPVPGPGLLSYTADFNVFNGTAPNGTWKLYVVDDQVVDNNSLPGGWSIDITAAPANCTGARRPVDFNGDGKSDYTVTRNTGGGPSGQLTWLTHFTGGADAPNQPWGLQGDELVPADYDGDGKTDISVWRPGTPFNSWFYILQSNTNTFRADQFGQSGDDPSVIGDYDGDGKVDPTVYRSGISAGDHSFWWYRSSLTNAITLGAEFGQTGDFPAPGDYDGDGKFDFVVQRNGGSGNARFFRKFSSGIPSDSVVFGTPTDIIVPGFYDADCKTDLAVERGSGGLLYWNILNSTNGSITGLFFGNVATDFPTQGDYDGDGLIDIAVWRPNVDPTQNFFYVHSSGAGDFQFEWGQNGDYPVANFNTH
ncbi:MAG: VCBS repeat-containing protein [Pyrinomonadaceae bacterium]